jgi:hypothetical protein
VEFEVTELVTRDVVTEQQPGVGISSVGDLDDLVVGAVQRKLGRYARRAGVYLVLLVYAIDLGAIEFTEATHWDKERGEHDLVVPAPLRAARSHLAQHGADPFDEVWMATPLIPDWAQISPLFPPRCTDSFASCCPGAVPGAQK